MQPERSSKTWPIERAARCPACSKSFHYSQLALRCVACKRWMHGACSRPAIGRAELSTFEKIPFVCHICSEAYSPQSRIHAGDPDDSTTLDKAKGSAVAKLAKSAVTRTQDVMKPSTAKPFGSAPADSDDVRYDVQQLARRVERLETDYWQLVAKITKYEQLYGELIENGAGLDARNARTRRSDRQAAADRLSEAGPSKTVLTSAVLEANEFMDELLEAHLPRVLPDRAERLRDFSCIIRKTLLLGILPTHRDLQANFSQGAVTGLINIKRKGNCNPTFADGRYAVVSCKLELGSLRASYASSIKGFNIVGDIAMPVVTADFSGSSLIFEARQIRTAESRPHMSALVLDNTKCDIEYDVLGLNAERTRLFRQNIMRNILPQVLDLINIRLYRALHDALGQQGVNLPEVRADEPVEE